MAGCVYYVGAYNCGKAKSNTDTAESRAQANYYPDKKAENLELHLQLLDTV